MNLGLLGYVNFPTSIALAGLGEEASQQQIFSLLRPLIPQSKPGAVFGTNELPDAKLQQIISAIFSRYDVLKNAQGDLPASVRGQIESEVSKIVLGSLGAAAALAFKDDIKSALGTLEGRGYSIRPKGMKAAELPPAQQTPAGVVDDATSPGPGKKSVALESLGAALSFVTSAAPLLRPDQKQRTAQELMNQQARGKKIYQRNWTLWITLGIGAVVGLAVVYAVARRK
jgi:hypothetical protein